MKTKLLSLFLLITLLFSFMLSSCNTEKTPSESTTVSTTTVSTTTAVTLPTFKDNEPYILEYTSNGDGTCFVSGILVNPNYENQEWTQFIGEINLVIPEKSPEGETVTGITLDKAFNDIKDCIPSGMITKDSFENILKEFEANGLSPNEFMYKRFKSSFRYLDASLVTNEAEKNEMYNKYPITRYLPVYVLDRDFTNDSLSYSTYLYHIRKYSSYEIDTPNNEREKFIKLLTEKGVTNPEDYLPKATDANYLNYGISIFYVSLPDTIVTISDNAFVNTNIREIVLPASVKNIGSNILNTNDNYPAMIYSLSTDENDPIFNQEFNFNCSVYRYSETEPTDTDANKRYWRYVDGKPVAWS